MDGITDRVLNLFTPGDIKKSEKDKEEWKNEVKKNREHVAKWKRFLPLAQKSIDRGDYKTAKRIYEGYREAVLQEEKAVVDKGYDLRAHSIKPNRTEAIQKTIVRPKVDSGGYDGLAYVYDKLGEFEKAGERIEELGDRYAYAGQEFEKAGKLRKAAEMYRKDSHSDGEVARLERKLQERNRSLSGRLSVAASIIGVFGGLFFFSSNMTGNVINNLNQTSSNWIGGILFIIGLIGAFAYFKIKN